MTEGYTNEQGPFTLIARAEIEGETLERVEAFVSRYEDGPPEGEKDRPITFNTIEQAEKWVNHNITPENIESMDWIIIPTVEAVELNIRDDLELDPETKKFI
jgi:hypothetical protein